MTFDASEKAPQGEPVELYQFTQSGAVTRYTSAANAQFIGLNEFTPLKGLSRTEPVQGNEASAGEVKVTLPSLEPIPQQFRGTIPSSLPSLTIFRKHLTDVADEVIVWFKGEVVSCAFKESVATLSCQPPTRLFSRPMPRAVYSGMCNHQLYDLGCQVVQETFDFPNAVIASIVDGTVVEISGLRVQAAAIDAAQLSGLSSAELDTYWNRGFIGTEKTPAEFRMIAEGNVSLDPDKVRLIVPFRDLSPGDEVTVFAGCPHSIDFCDRKFANAPQFGGFPQVPTSNPFTITLESGIDSSGSNSVKVSAFSSNRG